MSAESSEKKAPKNAPPQLPPGWRTGPAWREMNGQAARRRRVLGGVAGVLAVGAVGVLVLNPGGVVDRFRHDKASHARPAPLGPETGKPGEAPESPEGTATLDRPFAGSPALQYADGAAGIVPPEAAPVGESSKEQVASALKLTKDFLVAADLDPVTLRGERPAAALDLLEPGQEKLIAKVNAGLAKPGEENDPLLLFSRFDPNEVRMVGGTVKTRGRMTFAERKGGVVTVHADYTFVYPLTKKDKGSKQVARVIVRRVLDTEVFDPARFHVVPGKLFVRHHAADIGNITCEVSDGFIHPVFPRLRPHHGKHDETDRSGPTVDPYDRSRDLGKGDSAHHSECGTVTRT
ncbi:hypothetical protein [Streptomyces sp. NPDC037389]|uniref:hypothetical protein n=1 Tax=Streptomyces sp. NPDC037389 TaxID=3155369 RepID=UPI0034070475